jgi:outer membrane lipoprotein carrier protein
MCLPFMVAVPVGAQQTPVAELSGVQKVEALLQRISAVQAHLTTLQADFVQRKESHLLAEPSVSTGRLYFHAPDEVRWDYEKPFAMTVLLAGGVATTYRPDEKRAERIEIGRMQRKIFGFLSTAEPLDRLVLYFVVTLRDPGTSGNYELVLDPSSHRIQKRLKRVTIEIDRHAYLPVAVSYVERDGDRTAYSFSNLTVDKELPKDLFTLHLPADVEVVDLKLRGGEP